MASQTASVPPGRDVSRKILLIGLLLSAFAVWPLLHHVVVKHYFVSPWRLFGWAMYCVPVYQPAVRFYALQHGDRIEVRFPREQPDAERTYARFVRHRAELGTLVGPQELGRVLLAAYPQFDTVIVHVNQPVYHYDSDQIRQAFYEYQMDRIAP